ncbi:SDR family oxidoreductase [Actinoplanes sp. TBRC 11911]|uniref:SDR family oxidoreductase n=1 Tax=Actinoplanes sp. TBRC 11911 TaxID=2729386 RepID=UPI00145D616F|nr:SDR family oxidoreductase [Actinoplanes sp. TBRC 11911]NMO57607.1 SDR family oxidoreductase [Actinoplanes sp. TBRC 11911]
MTIAITGATGHFGRVVIESLKARGIPASDIIGVGRQVEKLDGLGVTVRQAAYEDREALEKAFAGADKLLFISGSEVGKRIPQHRNVVDAAKAAGVGLVVYTSAPRADTTDMKLAAEHRATERMLADSGLPHVILRNSWYVEVYNPAQAVEHGGLFGAIGDGLVSGAPRADYAEAAASVLAGSGHEGKVYELGGAPFTLKELAAEISRQSGNTVTYTDMPVDKYVEFLVSVGLPVEVAEIYADADRAASQGALHVPLADLEALLGRPATPLAEAVKASL